MIYPKASMPVTPEVLRMANERADRWMQRCIEARREVARLQEIIDGFLQETTKEQQ